MPPPEVINQYQTAVLWIATGKDDYGQLVVGSPIELCVRWVNKQRQAFTAQGEEVPLDATVIANRTIPIGSIMWLGCLEDWYNTGSAGQDTELMEVVNRDVVPDLKNREVSYQFGLNRYKNTLPATGS